MDHHNHLVNHIKHPELCSDNTLHVIGVLSNSHRYHTRLRLFREWYEAMLNTPNVKVYIVECAFGDRQYEVTEKDNPTHLQLRTNQTIWHKEAMINLAEKHLLPRNWKYICWSDTDVFWLDRGWALEAIQQLQHYQVVQPWTDCMDMGFFGNTLQHFKAFCYQHRKGIPKQMHPSQPYEYAHTGYSFCYRKDFWEAVSGLMDFSILGSADHHMAFSLINQGINTVHGKMHANFKKLVYEWQYRAYRACKGHLGFVKGTIMHKFHGPKKHRKYRERWQILIDHDFDSVKDLTYDTQGLPFMTGKPHLLHECGLYFNQRHEDEITDYGA